MKRLLFLLVLLLLFASACTGPEPSPVPTPTGTASPLPTLVPSQTPTPTPEPPTPTATALTIQGTLTIKVNVRSGPGSSFTSLGLLNAGQKVQVLARDTSGQWYQVLYPVAPAGIAWVSAQYVQIPAGTQVPQQTTPTPTGPTGRVLQRLNVRTGPGRTFPSLGTLAPDVQVSLTGKNATAAWFQILYPSGPGGRAWVTAQYIQTDSADGLPVLDDYGTPVPAGTAGLLPSQPASTPTFGPALADGDFAADPGGRVVFSTAGTNLFSYSSQVSAPQGDPEDWIAFTPYAATGSNARLLISLACSGNGTLIVELWQGGSMLSGWGSLACGDENTLVSLPAGLEYELRLRPAVGEGLQFVDYVLKVQNQP